MNRPEHLTPRVLLSPPDVGDAERDALLAAFDSGWIAPAGPDLDQFEVDLAAYVDAPAVVAVASGSAALRLALAVNDIGSGDEVVVATATFAASAFAVVHAGATPVLCDSEASSWCIDCDVLEIFLAERARNGRLPRAVMPVALYGSAPDYARLRALCAEYEIVLIDDAAEGLGSISAAGPIGSMDHATALSFNGNKIITTSSGGAFIGTPAQAERVRYLATQARMPVLHYEHEDIGFNFRLSNLLAAVGRAQLSRLDSMIERRTAINQRYRTAFEHFDWCPYEHTVRPNHWLSVALMPAANSQEVCHELSVRNIDARPAWKPMHLQPVFAECELVGSGKVSEDLFERGLCLPSGSVLSDSEIGLVIDAVHEVVQA